MKSIKPLIFGLLCLLLAGNFALAQNALTPASNENLFPAYISDTQASPALKSQDTPSFEMAQIPGTEQMRRIRVISPNGGEQWEKGKTYSVRWTSTGNIPEVKIALKWGPGVGIWLPVADRVPNTGEYSYTIPETVKQEGREFMIIVMTPDGLISDSSDSPFTIQVAKEVPKAAPMVAKPAPEAEKAEKFIKIKRFEIKEAKGYSEQELKQVQTELSKQKMTAIKTRAEKRIEEVVKKRPVAGILIPLLYRRIEEHSQKPILMPVTLARKAEITAERPAGT